jgi:hypothetical protein
MAFLLVRRCRRATSSTVNRNGRGSDTRPHLEHRAASAAMVFCVPGVGGSEALPVADG